LNLTEEGQNVTDNDRQAVDKTDRNKE